VQYRDPGHHHCLHDLAPAVVSFLHRSAPDGHLRAGLLPWWGRTMRRGTGRSAGEQSGGGRGPSGW
jgi:hypothetical protein